MIDGSDVSSDATDLQQKLEQMEARWQNVIQNAEQQRSVVDNRLALWQDYRQLLDRLSGMLDDVEQSIQQKPVTSCDSGQAKRLLDLYRVSRPVFVIILVIFLQRERCQSLNFECFC